MKDIEKLISPLVENQFPAFYKEDGPQFIAFIKAYYEWMEQTGNITNMTRSLPDFRDIDTTLEEFVVQFKEKYLKNIQFDTATNKRLLVKNALDLYRSKGTERSIDLFFKLVYGTDAEVKYPGENILRLSDGIWEKPEYLEISYNLYNIDYVGKQIIGALSGAKAFVEKYIRRRVERGYVNLLYISGIEGHFRNGEVIGINVDNVAEYTKAKRAQLIGSVDRVTIIDRSQGFAVGDTVSFQGSQRGKGGLARVAEVSAATGLVDFIFIDGGWGYTLDASSLISEKVLSLGSIVANVQSAQYFRLFEQLVEPVINIAFTSASTTLALGDNVYRYAANGQLAGVGRILDTEQTNGNGQITISHVSGAITNNVTYYTASNAASLFANTFEDRTIGGKVMGIPEVYTIQLSNQNGSIQVGQNVIQKNTTTVFAYGTVNSIIQTATGNVVVLINARGAFKNSAMIADATYIAGAGTIDANTANNIVVGSGTTFDNNAIGAVLYQASSNAALGTVESISNSTLLVLTTNALANVSANVFNYGPKYPIYVSGNNLVYADVNSISATVGIYDIRKFVNTIKYQSANNNEILYSKKLYQYNTAGNLISEATILTVDHNSGTATGNVTFIPIRGSFKETDSAYTNGNTGSIIVVTAITSNAGGDYINSEYARLVAPISNTQTDVTSISYGSGAQFGVGTIGDTEVIFIGTDLIGSNNVGTLDYDRKILTVASNTGFGLGAHAYQTVNKIAFNASSSVNAITGFIELPTANTLFTVGDNIRYEVATGNTVLNGLVVDDYYHVRFANTSGLILSYPYRKTDYINTSNFSAFANNKVNEEGHYLYKQVYGTVFESSTGVVKIKDRMNYFGNTSACTVSNTTNASNSNLIKYGTTTTNTAISAVTVYTTLVQANVPYASISIRAAAYGFPKNPQGDLADIIYSCLTFGRFEIGTIGALAQVDPGAEYNVDPYVLAYQPYVSAFDRNDFIITVKDATTTFVLGERINQTQANLIYYDLKVDSGAYSNTYDEIDISINTKDEINSTADFVYTPSNTVTFNANTGVAADFITVVGNPFVSNAYVRYYTDTGNTALTGLSNNAFYYVGVSNSSGITLSTTAGGANITITASTTVESGHNIKNYVNNFANNQRIIYRTPAANTVIDGLANNTAYYIVSSNTVGFKLSVTKGGSVQAINATAGAAETHAISTIPGYLPGDRVYQTTSPVMNASVQSIFSNATGDYVRVSGNTTTINVTTSNTLLSYSNPYVNGAVSTATQYQIISTAKGIIKAGSNSTVLYVKRLTFENTFKAGTIVVGDVSGAQANVMGISEDPNELYPIGLNAVIEANVITANGQVAALEVFDSGFGYTNAEIIQYVSDDNLRAGSAKIVIDGEGQGKGYYRSSKGFLSEDMYIHDGDYYQEYSYEVLSKISVDRYSDMFKKVMHVAGTKFFGSALIVEEANVALSLSEIATSQQVQFNSATDVDSANESIDTDIEARKYEFDALDDVNQETEFFTLTNLSVYNPSKLVVGDLVQYISTTGNFIGIGDGTSTLSNNAFYYVVFSNTSGVKISTTLGGSVLNVNTTGMASEKHSLLQYINPFANGDLVAYTVAEGNTAVIANITGTFVTNTGKVIDGFIKIPNNTFRNSDYVNVVFTDTTCNTQQFNSNTNVTTNTADTSNNFITITSHPFANNDSVLYYTDAGNTVIRGLTNNQIYYVIQANTNTFKLTTASGNTDNIVQLIPSQTGEAGDYLLRGFNGITNAASYYVIDSNTSGFKLSTTGARIHAVDTITANTVGIVAADDFIKITLANSHFRTGDKVYYKVPSGNTAITPLSGNTYYYITFANTTGVVLSTTSGGSNINITDTRTTAIAELHTLASNPIIEFKSSNTNLTLNLSQTQLTNAVSYYVVNTTPNTVKLSLTLGGSPINITANTTSSGSATAGHFLTKTVEE